MLALYSSLFGSNFFGDEEKVNNGVNPSSSVTGGMIHAEALRLLPNTNFQASNVCLTRFLRHKHLSFRRLTTSCRDLPSNAGENVRAFLCMCTPFLDSGFDRETMLNGDDPSTTATAREELKRSQMANKRQEFRCASHQQQAES